MIIEDIFSGENEKLYSVLLDPEEIKIFSKIQDEDYIESIESSKRNNKYLVPIAGTVSGSAIGYSLSNKNKKAALAGGLVGSGLGLYLGKRGIKRNERDIKRYLEATEKDKNYLRKKQEHNENIGAILNAGIYAGMF